MRDLRLVEQRHRRDPARVKNAAVGQSLQLRSGAGKDSRSNERPHDMRIRLKYYLCGCAAGAGQNSAGVPV
jgi:hypothetical protein